MLGVLNQPSFGNSWYHCLFFWKDKANSAVTGSQRLQSCWKSRGYHMPQSPSPERERERKSRSMKHEVMNL